MEQEDVYRYSPFNRSSHFSTRNQSLLLQFALMALVRETLEGHPCSAVMNEHLRLFPAAFFGMDEAIKPLMRLMKRTRANTLMSKRLRREGFRKLKPFFHISKDDESFWLFLIKQGQHLDSPENIMSLLQELYGEDLSAVSMRMSTQFAARGFSRAAKECVSRFLHLQEYA